MKNHNQCSLQDPGLMKPGIFSRPLVKKILAKFLVLLLVPAFAHSQTKTLKYHWRKISGPAKYTIVAPDSAVTSVTGLEEGVYQFELTVTNSLGLSSRDTMALTVRPPDNQYAKKSTRGRSASAIISGAH